MDASRLICVLLKLHFEIGTAGTEAVPALLAGLDWTGLTGCPGGVHTRVLGTCGHTSVPWPMLLQLETSKLSTFDFLLPSVEQDESSATAVFAQWGLHPGDALLAHLQV